MKEQDTRHASSEVMGQRSTGLRGGRGYGSSGSKAANSVAQGIREKCETEVTAVENQESSRLEHLESGEIEGARGRMAAKLQERR